MHSLELPNPSLSCADAREIVRTHWGLDAVDAEEIGSTQDQNFRIRTGDGAAHVLKAANPSRRRGELESQTAAIPHVPGRAPDCGAPAPGPTADGAEIVAVGGHDVRLVTWVD